MPPIETLTNSTPERGVLAATRACPGRKTSGASISAASVIAAGSVISEPSQRHQRQAEPDQRHVGAHRQPARASTASSARGPPPAPDARRPPPSPRTRTAARCSGAIRRSRWRPRAAGHQRHRDDQHDGPEAEHDLDLAQQVEQAGVARMAVRQALERLGGEGVQQGDGEQGSSRSPFLRPWNIVHQTIQPINSSIAPRASSKITHMSTVLRALRRRAAPAIQFAAGAARPPARARRSNPSPRRAGCAGRRAARRRRHSRHRARGTARARPRALGARAVDRPAGLGRRPRQPSSGRRCCAAASGRRRAGRRVRAGTQRDAAALSDEAARVWLQQRLQPYRVESLDGAADGLVTGYFEPLVEASAPPRAGIRVPLYGPPADLATPQALLDAPADRHAAASRKRCAAARSPTSPTRWTR